MGSIIWDNVGGHYWLLCDGNVSVSTLRRLWRISKQSPNRTGPVCIYISGSWAGMMYKQTAYIFATPPIKSHMNLLLLYQADHKTTVLNIGTGKGHTSHCNFINLVTSAQNSLLYPPKFCTTSDTTFDPPWMIWKKIHVLNYHNKSNVLTACVIVNMHGASVSQYLKRLGTKWFESHAHL